jgi:hypothetical protein
VGEAGVGLYAEDLLKMRIQERVLSWADDVADAEKRGGSELLVNPSLYGDNQDVIRKYLASDNVYITGDHCAQVIEEVAAIKVSECTGGRVLGRVGFRDGKFQKTLIMDVVQVARIERFLRKYAQTKLLEAAGSHIAVFIDETYLHNTHCRLYGWSFFSKDFLPTTQFNGVQVQTGFTTPNDAKVTRGQPRRVSASLFFMPSRKTASSVPSMRRVLTRIAGMIGRPPRWRPPSSAWNGSFRPTRGSRTTTRTRTALFYRVGSKSNYFLLSRRGTPVSR